MNFEKHGSPENRDDALIQALRNLPRRPAPATLLPRIMGRVHANGAEKRRWAYAPAGTLLVAIAVWLSWLGGKFYEKDLGPLLDYCLAICRTVFGALAGSLIGNRLGFAGESCHIALVAASVLMLAMYAACVFLGSCVYRIVRRGSYGIQ
jgi:hypothetical protein